MQTKVVKIAVAVFAVFALTACLTANDDATSDFSSTQDIEANRGFPPVPEVGEVEVVDVPISEESEMPPPGIEGNEMEEGVGENF